MKKYILLMAMVAVQIATMAQTVNVHFKNGQKIEFSSDNIDYVDFSAKASEPTLTPGQVVDLGLSVYWASCNLGATKPEEYGDLYRWGETSPFQEYTPYSYVDQSTGEYVDIGYEISGTEYDAATSALGSDWRMPTLNEMEELINKCVWEWKQINGINGYKITGVNGNSIFLPAAGYYTLSRYLGYGYWLGYWTSTKNTFNTAFFLIKQDAGYYIYGYMKIYDGLTIRPVSSNANAAH